LTPKTWNGIKLVHIPTPKNNALWSIIFDYKSTVHALKQDGIILVLGYNTAIFSLLYRLKGRVVLTNMDGMEWWREKWNGIQKAWLFINERCGIWFSDRLIADHPQIARYFIQGGVKPEKIATIPYGTEALKTTDVSLLEQYNLAADNYALIIARPEPENYILEIVKAFSRRRRGRKLVVLGRYQPEVNSYHARVMAAASDEVEFLGGVYDRDVVNSLRYYARLYVHGHTVGGTNPSLVEALAAGTPVLAHNNHFNTWVAGTKSLYFDSETHCAEIFDRILEDTLMLQQMRGASLQRYHEEFSGDRDLTAYELLLDSCLPQPQTEAEPAVTVSPVTSNLKS
ncbi:MAG: glycosyltransferase, partial [Cyanobacteria bacterium J06623_7]